MAGIPYTPNWPQGDYLSRPAIGGGRPMLFQVTKPGTLEPLYPYTLVLHVSPSSLDEQFTKSKNVIMSYGGFVEFVWPDELDSLSASASTGAFIGPDVGLTSGAIGSGSRGLQKSRREMLGRKATIAWERQEDLLDLYRSNGSVFNAQGQPVLRGSVQCVYDRGVFSGRFTTFEIVEDAERPFTFQLTWEFKVDSTVYNFPIRRQQEEEHTWTEEDFLAQDPNVMQEAARQRSRGGPTPPGFIEGTNLDPAVSTLGVIDAPEGDDPIDPEVVLALNWNELTNLDEEE